MSKRGKTQLDRIEGKLDEVLAFRDSLNQRIEGLLGTASALSGKDGGIIGSMVSGLLARSSAGNGTEAPKSGG
jgi:hypothetical protein